ncbi:hypothetical protein [Methanolapillus millepedarum]|uniref:hypothetical protein n=1 Tax=Methanolapillus millepedarum TaxID=3028296 RepID=UPI0030B87582
MEEKDVSEAEKNAENANKTKSNKYHKPPEASTSFHTLRIENKKMIQIILS